MIFFYFVLMACQIGDTESFDSLFTWDIPFRQSRLTVTTTSRLAGAIDSIEDSRFSYIDSFDHGRQLQSAMSMDCGKGDSFWPECFNPTEAGSRRDGAGNRSTSKLLRHEMDKTSLYTEVQSAYWLAPGERSYGRLAINESELSDVTISKLLLPFTGSPGTSEGIDHRILFEVPDAKRHSLLQFESLTGYMPAAFTRFLSYHFDTDNWRPIDSGEGEQPNPIMFVNEAGSAAMGAVAVDLPLFVPLRSTVNTTLLREQLGQLENKWNKKELLLLAWDRSAPFGSPPNWKQVSEESTKNLGPQFIGPGYGRFRFPSEKVVKWNVVFRCRDTETTPLEPGFYLFRILWSVGTEEQVSETIRRATRSKPIATP